MSWKSSTSSSETTNGLARLVSRIRSSHHCAAHSFANFGIKGTLAIYDSSAVFGFEVPKQTRGNNHRNFKFTALEGSIRHHHRRGADPVTAVERQSDCQHEESALDRRIGSRHARRGYHRKRIAADAALDHPELERSVRQRFDVGRELTGDRLPRFDP